MAYRTCSAARARQFTRGLHDLSSLLRSRCIRSCKSLPSSTMTEGTSSVSLPKPLASEAGLKGMR